MNLGQTQNLRHSRFTVKAGFNHPHRALWGSFCAAWTSDGRRVMCDRAGSNHVVDLYAISALRCRANHHKRCDGFSVFAFYSRYSFVGSKRRADAVIVPI